MKRRDFLTQTLQTSALAMGSSFLSLPGFSQALAAAKPSTKKVVVVFLRGAADILGMYSPKDAAGAANLAALRSPDLILKPETRIDAGLPYYIHEGLKPVFISAGGGHFGDVAVVAQSGSLNVTRSHFDQMDYIESGSDVRKTADGYLARAVLSLNAAKGPRPAVAVANGVPYMLRGADPNVVRTPAAVNGNLAVTSRDGQQSVRSQTSVPERLEMFTHGRECAEGVTTLCSIVESGQAEFAALKASYGTLIQASGSTLVNVRTGRLYADQKTDHARLGWLSAAILMGPYNPSVLTMDIGGWDTHNKEGMNIETGAYYRNVSALGGMLGALRADLKKQANGSGGTVWDDTVVVVMSEFGRTAVSNGSFGTDHGRGSAMLLMGGKVNQQHKNWQQKLDLANLDGDGSSRALRVNVDYRHVMAEVIQRHLGAGLSGVFDNYSPATANYLNVIKT